MKVAYTCLISASAFVLCQFAKAALTYDGFAYDVGTKLEDALDWSGLNSGVEPVISAGNLTVTGLESPTGNKVSWAPGNIREALASTNTYTSGTVYFSLAFQLTGLPTSSTYSFGLSTGNTNYGATIWLQADGEDFKIGLSNRSNLTPNYTTASFEINQTIFLVGSYEFAEGSTTNISSLWVNPDSTSFAAASAPPPTLTATGGNDLTTISQFLLRGASGSPSGEMDELRIGTTWASVTPIPEPAAALLGVLGLTGLLRRRR